MLHGFTKRGAARIINTVREVEGGGTVRQVTAAAAVAGGPTIQAQLGTRDGSDGTLYAWTQARRTTSGAWESIVGGLSGTLTDRPAINTATAGGSNGASLTGQYVTLARGVWKDGGEVKPCWYLVNAARSIDVYNGTNAVRLDCELLSVAAASSGALEFAAEGSNGARLVLKPGQHRQVLTTSAGGVPYWSYVQFYA